MQLTENQLQVILTGTFGDGHIKIGAKTDSYSTNGIYKDYIEFKKDLLGDICRMEIREDMNKGYKKASIFTFTTLSHSDIRPVHSLDIESKLNLLTDLGLSLWIYDDGSLHKKNMFYNLNTHAFSEEVHQELFVPFFDRKGFGKPRVLKDRKKDGREFSYLYFPKHEGSYEIAKLLNQYPIESFSYKRWSKEYMDDFESLLKKCELGEKYELSERNDKIKSLIRKRVFENKRNS